MNKTKTITITEEEAMQIKLALLDRASKFMFEEKNHVLSEKIVAICSSARSSVTKVFPQQKGCIA